MSLLDSDHFPFIDWAHPVLLYPFQHKVLTRSVQAASVPCQSCQCRGCTPDVALARLRTQNFTINKISDFFLIKQNLLLWKLINLFWHPHYAKPVGYLQISASICRPQLSSANHGRQLCCLWSFSGYSAVNQPFLSQKGLLTAAQTYFVFSVGLHPDTLDSFLVLLQLFFWQILYLQTDSPSPRCSTQPCLYTSNWISLHPEFYRCSPTAFCHSTSFL